MKKLKVSRELALPVDVAGEAIAILAKRGAGKTNTATVLVEELHAAGVQVVILDPVGAWWGIRSSHDGKQAGLPFAILGGQHGDVPLEHTAGALIADVVVENGESLLLDLSDFSSKAQMARFVVDFGERLFRAKARDRTLIHLVLEEADSFAPQKGGVDDARMRGAIEQIVRRGRSRGLGLTMVTQRSAVLNKDVLSQADVLIAMRTTSPHDVAAIKLWISAHADDELGVVESLPSLETGDAWVWNPERGLLERVRIRRRRTFDSSATPKAGEKRVEPKQTAPIDLAKLGAEIQATAERAKENDPTELRKKLRDLQKTVSDQAERIRALNETPAAETATVVETVEVPVVEPELVDRLEAELAKLAELEVAFLSDLAGRADAIRDAVGEITLQLRRIKNDSRADAGAPRPPRAEPPRPVGRHEQVKEQDRGVGRDSRGVEPARRPADPDAAVSAPQQRILDSLASLEAIGVAEASKVQLALFAGASPKSSSYSNNLGHLNNQIALIHYPRPGYVQLTPEGRSVASAAGAPSTAEEIQEFAYQLVGNAKARILRALVDVYDQALTKVELAERVDASPTSSSFSNNLGSLRTLGLIDYPSPGYVAALPILFLET